MLYIHAMLYSILYTTWINKGLTPLGACTCEYIFTIPIPIHRRFIYIIIQTKEKG